MFNEVTIRNVDHQYGIVEKYETYSYKGSDRIRILTAVSIDGDFQSPFIIRSNKFIPLGTSEDLAAGRYLSAKKGIYTIIDENSIIVGIQVKRSDTGEFSHQIVAYQVALNECSINQAFLNSTMFQFPEEVQEKIVSRVKDSFGDREKFLEGRYAI